jgi:peptidoglycan/LPS O-acetylase OafA/YrhL
MRSPISERRPALDGVRGLAALSVLCFHVYNTTIPNIAGTGLPPPLKLVLRSMGGNGVSCFLVLSAFLLTQPFLAWTFGQAGRPGLGRYASSRVFRILPAWWVVLLVMAIWLSPYVFDQPWRLLSFVTLTQNYFGDGHRVVPHGWTLVIEISFYAVMPLIACLFAWSLRRRGTATRVSVVVTAIAGSLVGAWLLPVLVTPPHMRLWLPYFADRFAVGTLAAAVFLLVPRLRSAWPLLLAAAAVFTIAFYLHPQVRYQASTVAFGFVILALAVSDGGLAGRLMGVRPLAHLGTISYSLYLWHLPLKYLAERMGWLDRGHAIQTPVALLAVFAASVVCAQLSYTLIERPALRLRHARVRRRSRQPAADLRVAPQTG